MIDKELLKITSNSPQSWLDLLQEVCNLYNDQNQCNAEEWNEITTALAWITEDLLNK